MRVNLKALAGVGGAAFAATGWGLYGSSGTNKPTTLTKQEENCCEILPPMVEASSISEVVKEQQRFVWEINTRDGIIDYKNGQIEELTKQLQAKEGRNKILTKEFIQEFNDNRRLKEKIKQLEKEIKDWEEYAEDLEAELDEKV